MLAMRSKTAVSALLATLAGVSFFSSCGEDGAGEEAAPKPVVTHTPPPPEPWFEDQAPERGITVLNRTGRPRKKELILGAVGPGAAVFDANGDGLLDVYIPNGNWLEGPQRDQFYQGADRPRNALYIQQEDGRFVDEARERGVDDDAWGFGACAADLDNDGDQDLIVANLGPNRLYRNDGTGHFIDIAAEAGIAGAAERGQWEWSTGIACGDYDRDGRLDLYISNYADMFTWLREFSEIVRGPDGEILEANVCDWQQLKVYCGPRGLPGQQDHLYHNAGGSDGTLRFEDVTKESGVWREERVDPDTAGTSRTGPLYGFQPLFVDLNRDGLPDIYVANDSTPSFFFENQGNGRFREVAKAYGIAVGANGEDLAGMGADAADVTGDGWPELHKTNFALQTNNLYVAEPYQGTVTFRDFSVRTGVREAVYTDLGWGVLVFDYDHDGDKDIFYANGHVYPEVDLPQARGLNTSFDQFNRMFRNDSRGGRLRFVQVDRELGPGFSIRKCSRGASLLDFDNDGDLDILVVNLNNTPDLLVNLRGNRNGHWLQLRLVGNVAKRTNRDAIGSRVVVRGGDHVQHFEILRGQGFLGCNDPRLHVGLGGHAGPVEVEITWPNGEKTKRTIEKTDREVRVEQD